MIFNTEDSRIAINSFNDIEKFNLLGGHLDKPNDHELNFNLLQEELNEYREAFEAGDTNGIADALGDMMVVLYGNILKEGYSGADFFSKILDPICKSNLSKFCYNVEDAQKSVDNYSEKGIETLYKEIEKGIFAIIKKDGGKILKGIHYKEPVLEI